MLSRRRDGTSSPTSVLILSQYSLYHPVPRARPPRSTSGAPGGTETPRAPGSAGSAGTAVGPHRSAAPPAADGCRRLRRGSLPSAVAARSPPFRPGPPTSPGGRRLAAPERSAAGAALPAAPRRQVIARTRRAAGGGGGRRAQDGARRHLQPFLLRLQLPVHGQREAEEAARLPAPADHVLRVQVEGAGQPRQQGQVEEERGRHLLQPAREPAAERRRRSLRAAPRRIPPRPALLAAGSPAPRAALAPSAPRRRSGGGAKCRSGAGRRPAENPARRAPALRP